MNTKFSLSICTKEVEIASQAVWPHELLIKKSQTTELCICIMLFEKKKKKTKTTIENENFFLCSSKGKTKLDSSFVETEVYNQKIKISLHLFSGRVNYSNVTYLNMNQNLKLQTALN